MKSSQSGGSKSSAAKMSSAQSRDSLFTEEPDDSLFSSMPKPKAHRYIPTPGAPVIKFFSCSTQFSVKFFPLINVKMPTIVGILTCMSRKK